MIVIGFDQAPRTIGYAYGEIGSAPTRGIKSNPDFSENTARLGKHVREWACNLIKSTGAQRVYFEQVLVRRHGFNMSTFDQQKAVQLNIEIAAEMCGLIDDAFEVDLADWRREFYRGERPTKGQDSESEAWKDLARRECANRGWLVEDHNAAEACGIWFYGCIHTDRRLYAKHKIEANRKEWKRWTAEAL